MNPVLADSAAAADLLDVFNAYDGSVIFQGLTESVGGQPALFGRIGWIFTAFGAFFALWGFVLRTQRSPGEGKTGEVVRTWMVIAGLLWGPLMMRVAMQGADSVFASSVGGPGNLTAACVKAAYAMPELSQLFDVLRKASLAQGAPAQAAASAQRQALISSADDGSVLGYLEAYGVAVWDTASDYASAASQSWNGMVRLVTLATGFGSAMLKCLLILATVGPLYLMLLSSAALIWFMQQLRYFFAVSGSMMLPLFVGMFSLPEGHFNRQAAQNYVMHMVSIALWPISWAIGHTGTIALYNALISLIAGTSRVSEIYSVLQWSSVTSASPSQGQLQAMEAALGNWFMGNLAALLSVLVGGLGFVLWISIVSIMGPVFLHRLLTTGAQFMTQAAAATGAQTAGAVRLAAAVAQNPGAFGIEGLIRAGPRAGERLSGAQAVEAQPLAFMGRGASASAEPGGSTMATAAQSLEDSDGKRRARM